MTACTLETLAGPASVEQPAVLVMARAPIPGACNTRLEPLLGPTGCARLQAALIARVARWAVGVTADHAYLAYTPRADASELSRFVPAQVRLLAQRGRDLGERLSAASEYLLAEHHGPLLIVGCDAPGLGLEHARQALALLRDGCDACFGPALDGGYYLLAINRSCPELFAIGRDAWGGPDVLSRSVAAARHAGRRVRLLEPLRDLDTPHDARALLSDRATPAEITALLADGRWP